MTTNSETLTKITLFNLDINLWGGTKQLKKEDVGLKPGKNYPPEKLASLGPIKVFDDTKLRIFKRLKDEMIKLCETHSVKMLGWYAVPNDKVTELAKSLDDVLNRVQIETDIFLKQYVQETERWAAANPEWRHVIETRTTSVDTVRERMHFDYQVFKVNGSGDDQLDRGLKKKAGGLADQLYKEIAQSANTTFEKSILGKDKVTQKALRPMRAIREKLEALIFLDPKIHTLISDIDDSLQKFPKSGHIQGNDLVNLERLYLRMTDPERLKQHSKQLMEASLTGNSVEAQQEQLESVEDVDSNDDLTVMSENVNQVSNSSGEDMGSYF